MSFNEANFLEVFDTGGFEVFEEFSIVYMFERVHISPSNGNLNFNVKII
jgi:hypothetical protein